MGGSSLRVLIVGAGIAGLATARALRLAGFRPRVVEQLPASAVPGAGIYLPGNAARALRALDVDGPVQRLGEVITRQHFLDQRGRPLCEVDLLGLWDGVGECRALPRSELHRVLLTAAGGDVHHETGVTGLDVGARTVTVGFDDRTSAEFDLVVGADGRRSAVRSLAALGGAARPVGQIVYRSVVTGGPKITEWTGLLGRRSGFIAVPMGAGRLYCYADEAGDTPPDDPRARLAELFADYGDPVPEIIEAIDRIQVARTDEVELGRWSRGRVVLVGDAAHATSPTLSQGAAMAFEDAVVLADTLRHGDDVEAALETYESRRRPRTKWVLDRTRDRERTRDVPAALRDPLLRGRGGRIFAEHYRLLVDPI
ncbi:FAD-dependent monooxygenase [Polymorphospora sp. NPDC051019]|uniref:FAD-dependent monooxygenase n=1 Tax=Polymorphospora sp. NPDC051019 TaxID=3155725 RepID=UPI003439D03A